jgi:SPP1 gp7 family putative phage head morphogenesis protein
MPLASKSTKKIKKKPIVIIPNNIKTLPKILPKSIISQKSFKEKVNNIKNDININIDDIPEDLLDTWDEFEEDILPKIVSKNYNLWLSIFIPFILPSFLKGISGKVELPFDAKQSIQTNAPSEKQIIDHAREYFKSRGLELVRTLSTTDCERLKGQMLDNWGKGPDAFKASFQEDYANTKARLDVIYRSEYICAQNEGILARARNSNHEFKQWNAALDERTCPVCGDQLHGTIIPIDEEFTATIEHKNGSEEISVNGPPAHPNCRCVLTTLDEEDYNEMKEDSAYISDAVETIKLNYNCPDSEKIGSGPGSCSGGNLPSLKKYPTKSENTKNYNNVVKYTEDIITKMPELDKAIKSYITSSTFMTHELIMRPDIERKPLDTEKAYQEFSTSNNLQETRWHGPTHDNIARLDEAMKHFKLPTDMVLYSGVSKNFYDTIPKNEGDEFKSIAFISTSSDESIAKSFAKERKKRDSDKPKFAAYLEIFAPSGSTGIATEESAKRANPDQKWVIGKAGSQKEVILNRQQKYKVLGIESDGMFKKIKLEMV